MLTTILTLIVAAIHGYITVLEMFMWDSARARRVFGTTPELASQTKAMAFNQGLYNGFLAVGLIVGLLTANIGMIVFLLLCVAVAGVFGAMSGVRTAAIAQTIPATLALLALWVGL